MPCMLSSSWASWSAWRRSCRASWCPAGGRKSSPGRRCAASQRGPADKGESMADAPFLERLAQMPPVSAAETAALLERLDEPNSDPVIGPLFGADDDGETVVNPLVPVVLQNLVQKEGL